MAAVAARSVAGLCAVASGAFDARAAAAIASVVSPSAAPAPDAADTDISARAAAANGVGFALSADIERERLARGERNVAGHLGAETAGKRK